MKKLKVLTTSAVKLQRPLRATTLATVNYYES